MNGRIAERVCGVLTKVAQVSTATDGFTVDADLFRDLGVDSTAALDILLSLEHEFGLAIPDDTFGNARSLRAIALLIAELELRR